MFIKIAKIVGLALASILMALTFAAVIFISWIDPADLQQNFHEQYLTHQSEQYMNTMAEHEREDQLKADCGLTMCQQNK